MALVCVASPPNLASQLAALAFCPTPVAAHVLAHDHWLHSAAAGAALRPDSHARPAAAGAGPALAAAGPPAVAATWSTHRLLPRHSCPPLENRGALACAARLPLRLPCSRAAPRRAPILSPQPYGQRYDIVRPCVLWQTSLPCPASFLLYTSHTLRPPAYSPAAPCAALPHRIPLSPCTLNALAAVCAARQLCAACRRRLLLPRPQPAPLTCLCSAFSRPGKPCRLGRPPLSAPL